MKTAIMDFVLTNLFCNELRSFVQKCQTNQMKKYEVCFERNSV